MLKKLIAATLYTALSLTAIAAHGFDLAEIEAMQDGKMRNLVFHAEPRAVSDLPFETPEGEKIQIADYAGSYLVLNFWATWCAPCREEMPSLDKLSAEFSGRGVEVISIASGHNPLPAIRKFYESAEIETLPILLDPKGQLSREMGVLALPITVLIDPSGNEIARMKGDADWFSESAVKILSSLAPQ